MTQEIIHAQESYSVIHIRKTNNVSYETCRSTGPKDIKETKLEDNENVAF